MGTTMRALLVWVVLAAPVAAHAQDDAMSGPNMPRENGRGDMTLTREPASAPAAREGRPDREIVKPNGRLVVTVPESGGTTQLTLPPGEYIVRYRGEPGDHVHLVRGAMVALDKYGLSLVGAGARQPHYAPPSEDEYSPEEQPYEYAPRRPAATGSANDCFVLHLALGSQDDHSSSISRPRARRGRFLRSRSVSISASPNDCAGSLRCRCSRIASVTAVAARSSSCRGAV